MLVIDPLANLMAFKQYLSSFKEDKVLDKMIEIYVKEVLKHRIIHLPSKGRYGEQGKDIVSCENEETLQYCAYIIKQGNLSANLNGNYGILKQPEDAMKIELDEKRYHGRKRTAIVVYNGDDGNRGAVKKFEDKKNAIEANYRTLISRPIERWDLEHLAPKLFLCIGIFKTHEILKNTFNQINADRILAIQTYETFSEIESISDEQVKIERKAALLDDWSKIFKFNEDMFGKRNYILGKK